MGSRNRNWVMELRAAIVLAAAPLLVIATYFVASTAIARDGSAQATFAVAFLSCAIAGIVSLVAIRSWSRITSSRAISAAVIEAICCGLMAKLVVTPLYQHGHMLRRAAFISVIVAAIGLQLAILSPGIRKRTDV